MRMFIIKSSTNQLVTNVFEKTCVSHDVCSWDNYFTETELDDIRHYCVSTTSTTTATVVGATIIPDPSVRVSKTAFYSPNNDNAWIYGRLLNLVETINESFFQYDLLGFDTFQYTEYSDPGSHYDFHTDMIFGRNVSSEMIIPRKLSISLLLSDPSEYTGGDFEIMSGKVPTKIPQPKGRAIAFPSYSVHRVTPVLSGVRRSLVIWVLGPKFR
jgi:PKHD-type hydroxylase